MHPLSIQQNPKILYWEATGYWNSMKKEGKYIHRHQFHAIINALSYDRQGILWIGTNTGLFKMESDSTITAITNEAFGSVRVYDLQVDSADVVWVATSKGVLRCYKNSCKTIVLEGLSNSLIPCKALALDQQRQLWIGTSKGVFKAVNDKFKMVEIPFYESLEDVYDILIDRTGILWVATENHVTSINVKSLAFNSTPPTVFFGKTLLGKEQLSTTGVNEIDFDPDYHNLSVDFSVIAFNRANQVTSEYKLIGYEDTSWQQTEGRKNCIPCAFSRKLPT